MNDTLLNAMEQRLNGATWEGATKPAVLHGENVIVLLLPRHSPPSVEGHPINDFLTYVRMDMRQLIAEVRRLKGG